ncbi:MAG: response regulator [Allosphingosinicella sp.]
MSLHALIIEDDVSMVDSVEQALRGAGYYSFDIAFSASEAIAAAYRRCPDIITANLRLVDGSGVDVVLEICSGQAIPVIFITSLRSEIDKHIRGAIIVEKPFVADDIAAACALAVATPFSSPAAY